MIKLTYFFVNLSSLFQTTLLWRETITMKAERRQKIHALLQSKPFVSLKELSELFPDVTSMTLRRDIEYFEQQGELIKVRNGARSMRFIAATADEGYFRREKENEGAKKAIADEAKRFFDKGKCHFIDSGSTALHVANALYDEVLTVVTPCPNVALSVAEKSNPIIVLVGGIFNRESLSSTGDMSISALQSISIDTAFIVPSGFSSSHGFTCGNYSECELKKYVVKNAKRVIMLIDSSKFEKNLPYTFCDISDVDIVITDSGFERYSALYAQHGVNVITSEKRFAANHVSKCIPIEI